MQRPTGRLVPEPFEVVRTVGLSLPDVEATTKYDGSPALKLGGAFLAGLATHPSAEPHTLVVRVDMDERASLLDDAPGTYYLTDYYRGHPVVLVRLSRIDRAALRDLLCVSWRLTLPKARMPGRRGPGFPTAGRLCRSYMARGSTLEEVIWSRAFDLIWPVWLPNCSDASS